MLPNARSVLLRVSQPKPSWQALEPGRPWIYVSGEAMSGHSQTFAPASVVVVNHNLGRMPCSCTVRTLGGVEVEVEVQHVSPNQCRLYFDVPIAGTVELM